MTVISSQEKLSEGLSRFLMAHQQTLGYTVPFTLDVLEHRTEDKLKIQKIHKLSSQLRKSKECKIQQTKLPWFSCLLRHSTRKWVGLIRTNEATTVSLSTAWWHLFGRQRS